MARRCSKFVCRLFCHAIPAGFITSRWWMRKRGEFPCSTNGTRAPDDGPSGRAVASVCRCTACRTLLRSASSETAKQEKKKNSSEIDLSIDSTRNWSPVRPMSAIFWTSKQCSRILHTLDRISKQIARKILTFENQYLVPVWRTLPPVLHLKKNVMKFDVTSFGYWNVVLPFC